MPVRHGHAARSPAVWVEDAVVPFIREAAVEAYTELESELFAEIVEEEVVAEMVLEAARSAVREEARKAREHDRARQAALINESARRIAHIAALRLMLANLATRGNAVARQDVCERLLKGMMLRHLLARAQQLHAIEEVRANPFLRAMHEHATSRMTTALLVQVMSGPALEFEEDQIHQRELREDSVHASQSIGTLHMVSQAVHKLRSGSSVATSRSRATL